MYDIVVLGGGVGGITAANHLARRLSGGKANITLVSDRERHDFQHAQLYIPFETIDRRRLSRPLRKLLRKNVDLVLSPVVGLDTDDRWVELKNGRELSYDYLVISTGCRLVPALIPDLKEAADHFFDQGAAYILRSRLHRFKGGRIVVGVASLPIKFPLGPVEFTFLLDAWLRERGLRDATEIVFTYPADELYQFESVAKFIRAEFRKRGIKYKTPFRLRSAHPEEQYITSAGGTKLEYDLLVMIPPNRPAEFLQGHAIADENGFVRTLPHTLQAKDAESVWTIGDTTNLPVSMEASTAHFEARSVVEQIACDVTGELPKERYVEYRGHVISFLETGNGEAAILDYDRERPPKVPPPSEAMYFLKRGYFKAYWQLLSNSIY